MKQTIHLLLALIALALGQAGALGGTNYWDSNGATPGAGNTPTGIWDSDLFWSTDPGGAVDTAAWTAGDTAVFSAGTDATSAYTVTVASGVNAGGIIFEEGLVTVSGASIVMSAADFPIIANTPATIGSSLEGFGIGFKKTGPGTLTLGGTSGHDGTNTIVEGVVAITAAAALGSTLAPTIVSNGAALEQTAALAWTEMVILNGSGVTNGGAFYARNSLSGNNGKGGATILGADARINNYATVNWWNWNGSPIVGTNDGNNFNVYFGGNGVSTRLNVSPRAMYLGTGAIYKDGSCELRFETPALAGALYWNEGHIMSRVAGGFLTAASPIYVGAGAGQFRNGNNGPSVAIQNAMALSAGANPVFRPYAFASASITCNGVLSGEGGLSKYNDAGTLNLNAANTYSGNTVIRGGTLALGASGSISNSAVIEVQSGATFNVAAVPGGFVLQAGQTLKGNGTVSGSVIANGTVSPGASIGTLTFNNDLTLAGNLLIEVNKAAAPANDSMQVTGALANTGTGTVTVTNLGWWALAAGDSFQIFNQPVVNGEALTVVSAGGVVWTNKLAENGTIAVVSAPAPVPATNLTIQALSPTSYQLSGWGAPNSVYGVLTQTNIAEPMVNWSLLGITTSDGSGLIQFVDPLATGDQRYYRFGQ